MGFVTSINSAGSHYGQPDPGGSGFYLDWITDAMRSRVTDPDSLPAAPKERRRILWITDTLGAGGAERLVETGVRLCVEAGHKVWLWALQKPADGNWTMSETGGVEVGYGDPNACVRLCRAQKIEVAFLSNFAGSGMVEKLDKAGVACIGIPYGFVEWNLRRIAVPGVRDHLAAVWAYQNIGAGLLEKGYDFPTYRFLAPIDLDDYDISEMRQWGPPWRIAYCGRMSNEKNLAALLRVFQRVQEKTTDKCILHVIGGVDPHSPVPHQEYWAACEKRFHDDPLYIQLQNQDAIAAHGYVSGLEAIKQIMNCMHFLVLTSDFEGEPVVFLEAAALGTLCVGRRMSENVPLLDGCGILSAPKTERMSTVEVEDMADKIVATMRRPADDYYRMAGEARRRVAKEHDGPVWLARLERIVADVLRRRVEG